MANLSAKGGVDKVTDLVNRLHSGIPLGLKQSVREQYRPFRKALEKALLYDDTALIKGMFSRDNLSIICYSFVIACYTCKIDELC